MMSSLFTFFKGFFSTSQSKTAIISLIVAVLIIVYLWFNLNSTEKELQEQRRLYAELQLVVSKQNYSIELANKSLKEYQSLLSSKQKQIDRQFKQLRQTNKNTTTCEQAINLLKDTLQKVTR